MKKLSKTKQVFEMICEAGDVFGRAIGGKNWGIEYDYEELMARQKMSEQRARRQAIWRLKERKLISIRKRGRKVYIALTEDGCHHAMREAILRKTKELPNGKYCLVTFDVPEALRSVREALRQLLRECDFEIIHQSVWISRRDVVEDLKSFIERLDADDWVKVFLAEEK